MPKGGNRDGRETYVVESLRMKNRAEVPPAPSRNAVEFYCRQGSLYWLDESGVEHAFGGVGVSAFPGWSWGKTGAIGAGVYLLNEGIDSSSTGRYVSHLNPIITKVRVANSAASTCTIVIQEHDGVTYTDLASISLSAERNKDVDLTVPVTRGLQLAVKVSAGTANSPVVDVIVDGIYK